MEFMYGSLFMHVNTYEATTLMHHLQKVTCLKTIIKPKSIVIAAKVTNEKYQLYPVESNLC